MCFPPAVLFLLSVYLQKNAIKPYSFIALHVRKKKRYENDTVFIALHVFRCDMAVRKVCLSVPGSRGHSPFPSAVRTFVFGSAVLIRAGETPPSHKNYLRPAPLFGYAHGLLPILSVW